MINLTIQGNVELTQQFDPNIKQVARNLAQINRWCGDTKHPFSVAQHSILVSYLVPPAFALEALLHDATEAYLGDLPAPVKKLCPDYQRLEDFFRINIARQYGIPRVISPDVAYADRLAAQIEDDMLRNGEVFDGSIPAHMRAKWALVPSYTDGMNAFLKRFKELYEA